jgi:hypothetical protein
MGGLQVNRYVACLIAGSLIFSSSAAVASAPVARAQSVQQIDPWAALSALSGVAPAAALCGAAATAAATAAAVQAAPGCVLPVVDAAPVVSQAGPPPPTPVPPVEPVGGGFGIDPLLVGLGVLVVGALVYFLVIKKKHHHESSPA